MENETALKQRVERLEVELAELRGELLTLSSQSVTLAEALREETNIAGRILASIEKTKLKPEQLH